MTTTILQPKCPLCGGEARLVTERRQIAVGRRRVTVDDEHMSCAACDESFYTPEQSRALEHRAREQSERDENLLSSSDVAKIRISLGMSQPEFDELLGVAAKSTARWECGRVRQNVATDRLIRLLAADRQNVSRLAAINGVVLRDSCFVPAGENVQLRDWDQWSGYSLDMPSFGEQPMIFYVHGTAESEQKPLTPDEVPRGRLPVEIMIDEPAGIIGSYRSPLLSSRRKRA